MSERSTKKNTTLSRMGAGPCFVCPGQMVVKVWKDHHTKEVIAVVDWCNRCHSSRPHREGAVSVTEQE